MRLKPRVDFYSTAREDIHCTRCFVGVSYSNYCALFHIEMLRGNPHAYEGRPGIDHVRLGSGSTETVAGTVKEYDRRSL
jgi:hypothetical protein